MVRTAFATERAIQAEVDEWLREIGKPKRGKRRTVEDSLHKQVADHLTAVLSPEVPWTTIAHGLRLTIGQAVKAKRRGTKPGWPDLIIVWCGRPIFIELKRPKDLLGAKGRTGNDQRAAHVLLDRQGCVPWICTSIRDVENCLNAYGVPMRGRIAA